jgi:hypothetical protein
MKALQYFSEHGIGKEVFDDDRSVSDDSIRVPLCECDFFSFRSATFLNVLWVATSLLKSCSHHSRTEANMWRTTLKKQEFLTLTIPFRGMTSSILSAVFT